jgi:hypothetical protein
MVNFPIKYILVYYVLFWQVESFPDISELIGFFFLLVLHLNKRFDSPTVGELTITKSKDVVTKVYVYIIKSSYLRICTILLVQNSKKIIGDIYITIIIVYCY